MKITAHTKTMNKTLTNVIAFIVALSLVFLQMPVFNFAQQALADSASEASAEAKEAGSVDVGLSFENAYINYDGQSVAPPASKVTLPLGADFEFEAVADSGYEISSVVAELGGQQTTLEPDGSGYYSISGSAIQDGSAFVSISAVSAPEEEEAVEEEQAAEAVEKNASAESEELEAASPESEPADAPAASVAAGEPKADVQAGQRNTESKFAYDDDIVEVTATLADPAVLPAGVQFSVTPVTKGSSDYNYNAYMTALNNQAEKGVEYTDQNTLLYDVAFLAKNERGDTVEVQPTAGSVNVEFKFKPNKLSEAIEATKEGSIEVTHLPLSDSAKEGSSTTAEATNISASDVSVEQLAKREFDPESTTAVEVNTTSFSLYGVNYSAATTGDQQTESTEVTQGKPASSDAENAAEQIAAPVKTEAKARAASVSNTSTNLVDYLVSASIVATQDANGAYLVTPGSSYAITLSFAENTSLQFPNDGSTLTYSLPAGLNAADGQSGSLTMKVNDAGTFYSIKGNTYRIENGVLYFNFNTSDENFSKLAAANNAKFTVKFDGSFDENAERITFKDGITKDLDVDTSNSVTTSKYGVFNKANNTIDYTVSVKSKGLSKNVVVTDEISGNVVTLDASSIKATSSTGNSVTMNGGANGNSFTYTIPSMKNGEVITLKYSAKIDPTKINMTDGKIVSSANNSVTVKSDGDPNGGTANTTTSIDYTPTISKSNGTITAENGAKKTLSWTITANADCKVSMAGGTITDTITSESQQYMKYSGEGIQVQVYDPNNKLVRTDTVEWSNLTRKSDSSWTYTVPASDKDKTYKYVISYTTEADITGLNGFTNVGNTVVTDGGQTSTGGGTIGTGGNSGGGDQTETPKPSLNKSVEKVDVENKEISWAINFTVPAGGLTKAVLTDTFPLKNPYIESVKEQSIEVTGLTDGETYDKSYNMGWLNNEKVRKELVLTFKNDGKEGLKATGSERTVTVRLKTEINDEWLKAVAENGWYLEHQNLASLDYGHEPLSASAAANLSAPTLKKTLLKQETANINGVNLPVYHFSLTLTDVKSDLIEIEDVFDTDLLTPYANGWENLVVWGDDNVYWPDDKSGSVPASYVETPTGIKIVASGNSLPKKDNGEFYPAYRIDYWLVIKDQEAYNKLVAEAAETEGGKYTSTNTATWGDVSDEASFSYQYSALKKEILTSDNDLQKSDEDIWADFRITLNSGGQLLNGGQPLIMTDTFNNLSIDYNSITATPSEGVSWDVSGNVATYTIPDQTPIVITYRARVVVDDNGNVGEVKHINFSNVAEMNGHRGEVNKTAQRTNSGVGAASVPAIRLLKYEAGDMTSRLSGATFALLDANGNPVHDKDGNEVTFTTGDDGLIEVRGDQEQYGWALSEDTRYYLREIVAPAGHMLAGFDYSFQISGDGTTDYSKYIYHTGDTMSAKNYKGTDVKVVKEWSDGNADHNSDSVTVKLQQKIGNGEWSDIIREEVKNDEGKYVWQDTQTKTVTLTADNNWAGVFTSLPTDVPASLTGNADDVAADYKVVETLVNSETPKADTVNIVADKEGGSYKFTVQNYVENTQDVGDLVVSKHVVGTEDEKSFAFTVELDDKTINGTYGNMTFEGGKASFELSNGQSMSATGLPAGLKYSVSEQKYEGYTATAEGAQGEIAKDATAKAAFTNAYEAAGSATLSGKKTITGRDFKQDDKFTFQVAADPNTPMPKNKDGEKVSSVTIEPTGGKEATIDFGTIGYKLDDAGKTYTYTISEVVPEDATMKDAAGNTVAFKDVLDDELKKTGNFEKDGVTYSAQPQVVTVNVKDKGDGTLQITYGQGESVTDTAPIVQFTNAYTAEGSVTLHGTKTLRGQDITAENAASFNYVILEGKEIIATGKTNADGSISYDSISYNLNADASASVLGNHTYTVREIIPEGSTKVESGEWAGKWKNGCYLYDGTNHEVVVNVADNGNGTLTAKVVSVDGVEAGDDAAKQSVNFANAYEASGTATIMVTKELLGRNLTATDKFSFQLKEVKNGAETVLQTVENDEHGAVTFAGIDYKREDAGTHTYTISEVKGTQTDIAYSEDVITATVNVTDNGNGTMNAVVSYDKNPSKLTNTYVATGTAEIKVTKQYDNWNDSSAFNFTITAPEGTPMPENSTATATTSERTASFGTITFTTEDFKDVTAVDGKKTKTFTYTVSEDAPATVNDGVTYDVAPRTVTITATDNGNGTITTTQTAVKNDGQEAANGEDSTDPMTFVNTYTAAGSVTFQGEKTMSGRALKDSDRFDFTIVQTDEKGEVLKVNRDGQEVNAYQGKATATGASGKITYPKITYNRADMLNPDGTTYATSKTFWYKVTEDVPADATITDADGNEVKYEDATDEQKAAGGFSKNGVTYAASPKTFKVEVTDDGKGTLNAVATEVSSENGEGALEAAAADADQPANTDNANADQAAAADGADATQADAAANVEPTKSSAGELSKTATNLNGNYDSTVRVKLQGEPVSDESNLDQQPEPKTYDLVFVVDTSQSQGDTATALMNKMLAEAEKGGYNVNIGIVKYYYVAKVVRYLDGTAGWNGSGSIAGTNLPAGILLGTQLLDQDASVANENKYLVVLGDGDTYIYQQNNQLSSYTDKGVLRTNGDHAMVVTQWDRDYKDVPFAGPGSYSWKYHNGSKEPEDFAAPDNWDAFFQKVGAQVAADKGAYETEWDWHKDNLYKNATNAIPEDEINDHANSADTSLYYSLVNFKAASEKYNTYAAFVSGGYDRPYGESFMTYLNGGASLDLSKLEDTLVEDLAAASSADSVAKGGIISDTIGYGYDDKGNAYDMDFVNSIETTDIILNGKTLSKKANEDGAFEFGTTNDGKPLFTLTYTGKETPGTESYTVTFSDEVKATDTVEMRYNVHLTNPQTKTGTYGSYDETGNPGGVAGLLVSSQATFTRGDSTQTFANPVVSYSALGFDNTYTAKGSITFDGTKTLEGRNFKEGEQFGFEVLKDNQVVATGTSDASGKITFSAINYTQDDAGKTYTYTVREVVPEDATMKDAEGKTVAFKDVSDDELKKTGNFEKEGVTYSAQEKTVNVTVSDNGNGTLNVQSFEDATALKFKNTYKAVGEAELFAAKTLEGPRALKANEFTFELFENGNVIATAKNDGSARAHFTNKDGKFEYTQNDVGEHHYTVKETVGNSAGVTYDTTEHSITVNVADNGDGTLSVTYGEGYDPANGVAFTNKYSTSGQFELVTTKLLDNKAPAADAYEFQLLNSNNEVVKTAKNAADGKVTFSGIGVQAPGTYEYKIKEVVPAGAKTLGNKSVYNNVVYDTGEVTAKVVATDNGESGLNFVITYGDKKQFENTTVANASFNIDVQKVIEGREFKAGDEFTFTIEAAPETTQLHGENVPMPENKTVTIKPTSGPTAEVDFGDITFNANNYDSTELANNVYGYVIKEVVPENATGMIYDQSAHRVNLTLSADQEGKLVVTPEYVKDADASADESAPAPKQVTITNTAWAGSANIEFNKYYYAAADAQGTFSFRLTALDAEGNPRTGDSTPYDENSKVIDEGNNAFTITVQNGTYEDSMAKVEFPEIAYLEPGEYRYLVEENESTDTTMVADSAKYQVIVTVGNDGKATSVYELIYDGTNYGPTDDHSFYNNSAVMLGFDSVSAQSYNAGAERVSVYPEVFKKVNDDTALLLGGDFTFTLSDTSGALIKSATNDENGVVAFFEKKENGEDSDPGMVYAEPGTYEYVIHEINDGKTDITYDTDDIKMTVTVSKDDQGALQADVKYASASNPDTPKDTFYNTKEGIDVKVQKVSRFGGEGLDQCTYGLWMVGENGDMLVQEATSDATGWIEFKNVNLMKGQKYYFKEVEAPAGHTVDPYRTAYFSLNETGDALVLVEKTAADGWHSATENIENDTKKTSEAN